MRIKLIKDITESGRLKVSKHRGKFVPFTEGTFVEASDATAAKWIAAGLAEVAEVAVGPETAVSGDE